MLKLRNKTQRKTGIKKRTRYAADLTGLLTKQSKRKKVEAPVTPQPPFKFSTSAQASTQNPGDRNLNK